MNNPPFSSPNMLYSSVIVVQVFTKMSDAVQMMLAVTINMRVLCRLNVSEMLPPISDPITREMVNNVVINPICETVSFNCMFINNGAPSVISPLFRLMIGKSIARESVVFFLNSFKTIFVSFFCGCCSRGFLVIDGMIINVKMMNPAVRNAIGKFVCSAM